MNVELKIHEEHDLSKFVSRGNRRIKDSHVMDIVESIKVQNRLNLHPVIVVAEEDKFIVIDGQHRIEACRFLKIPVLYVIDESPKENSIIWDQVSRNWALSDYFEHFVGKKYPDYIKIQEIVNKYHFSLSVIFAISHKQKQTYSKEFREGKFAISDKMTTFFDDIGTAFLKAKRLYSANSLKYTLNKSDLIRALYWFNNRFPEEFKTTIIGKFHEFCMDLPPKATNQTYEYFLISKYNEHREKGCKKLRHPNANSLTFLKA